MNADKNELLWFSPASSDLSEFLSGSLAVTLIQNVIETSPVVGDLDVSFDTELSMHQHVSRTSMLQTSLIYSFVKRR